MIFIGGIHGVGKTYFCNQLRQMLNVPTYTASELITERIKSSFSVDKKVKDIKHNQEHLVEAIKELQNEYPTFALDGHFCLLDDNGKIVRLPEQTFVDLNPKAIVLLTEEPQIIINRRKSRDGVDLCLNQVEEFQDEEVTYAQKIAKMLNIPFMICRGNENLISTLKFIEKWGL